MNVVIFVIAKNWLRSLYLQNLQKLKNGRVHNVVYNKWLLEMAFSKDIGLLENTNEVRERNSKM